MAWIELGARVVAVLSVVFAIVLILYWLAVTRDTSGED